MRPDRGGGVSLVSFRGRDAATGCRRRIFAWQIIQLHFYNPIAVWKYVQAGCGVVLLAVRISALMAFGQIGRLVGCLPVINHGKGIAARGERAMVLQSVAVLE